MIRTALLPLLLLLLQNGQPPLSIQPSKLRPALVGRDYVEELTLSSPIQGVTWHLDQGDLPNGIELIGREERALLVGRPTIDGESEFSISVWNESGRLAFGKFKLLVQSYEPSLPTATPGQRPGGITGSVLGIVDSALKMADTFAQSGAAPAGSNTADGQSSDGTSATTLPPSSPPTMKPQPATKAESGDLGTRSSNVVPERAAPLPEAPRSAKRPEKPEETGATPVVGGQPADVAWQMLVTSEAEYQKVRSYQCLFIKQERSPSGMGPEEQIRYYFHKPFAVRMEWIAGPHKGRKAVFVQGRNGDQLMVREGGLLGLVAVRLDPRGSTAMRGEHHPITESGIGAALGLIRENFKRGREAGEVEVELLGEKQQGGRSLRGFRASFPNHQTRPYYSAKAEVWVDLQNNKLPYAITTYDQQGRVYERYVFSELRLNPELANNLFAL